MHQPASVPHRASSPRAALSHSLRISELPLKEEFDMMKDAGGIRAWKMSAFAQKWDGSTQLWWTAG